MNSLKKHLDVSSKTVTLPFPVAHAAEDFGDGTGRWRLSASVDPVPGALELRGTRWVGQKGSPEWQFPNGVRQRSRVALLCGTGSEVGGGHPWTSGSQSKLICSFKAHTFEGCMCMMTNGAELG